jgi:membrane-bound lytic murein transglycosylase D
LSTLLCRTDQLREKFCEFSSPWVAVAARSLTFFALAASLSACAHFSSSADGTGPQAVSEADKALIKETPGTESDLSDNGSDLSALPIEVNKLVLQWIDYFQGQGRPHMERYLSRSTRYMPIMKAILKKEGLPEDLIYIALIESGFNSTAHSSASAVGYWQFIRGTGKHYGLKIDPYVDERRDFVKSTQAAADYFKGLYNLFGAWYLAIASYNVGENRVKSVVMKYHTRDFWQLARENKLPEETINYVPKFLAARLIAKEPEKYGFGDVEYLPPLEFAEVDFPGSVDIRKLSKEMNIEYDDLRDLNPSYKRGVAFASKSVNGGKLSLRVPKGSEALAVAAAANAVAENKQVYVADEDYNYYRVRRGDTIASVAEKFGTSQRQIRNLNKLSRGSRLVVGRRIRVPGETIAGLTSKKKEKPQEVAAQDAVQNGASPSKNGIGGAQEVKREPLAVGEARKVHIVQKGDTLIQIAQQYQVPLRELTRHNQLNRRAKIAVGAKLEIP